MDLEDHLTPASYLVCKIIQEGRQADVSAIDALTPYKGWKYYFKDEGKAPAYYLSACSPKPLGCI